MGLQACPSSSPGAPVRQPGLWPYRGRRYCCEQLKRGLQARQLRLVGVMRTRRRAVEVHDHGVVCDVDSVPETSAPSGSRAGLRDEGSVDFTYTLGPGGSLQVTREDVMSLTGENQVRDGVVDVLACHIGQELIPVEGREDTNVFFSVFYFLLCRGGPSRVRSLSRRDDLFDLSS